MPDPSYALPQSDDAADEDANFKKGFGELAFKALAKGNPELAHDVVTFVVLDGSAAEGHGVGTFVIAQDAECVYVPVVVSDNAVKPLDVVYSKRLDRFFPLTPEFLRLAAKGAIPDLGTAVNRPPTLHASTMLRAPAPLLSGGRYGFAADASPDPGGWARSVRANDGHGGYTPALLGVLHGADRATKLGFAKVLDANPRLRTRAVEVYGKTALAAALAVTAEKTAVSREVPLKHDVYAMDAATALQDAKRELGSGLGEAYAAVRLRGFFVKDRRTTKTDPSFALAERAVHLEAPSTPGLYRVFLAGGKSEEALVVPNPIPLQENHAFKAQSWERVSVNRYLIVFKDGRYADLEKLIAEPLLKTSTSDVREFLGDRLKAKPTNDAWGCLVALTGMTVRATEPTRALQVTTANRETSFKARYGLRVVIDETRSGNRVYGTGADTRGFPGDYRWLSLDDSAEWDLDRPKRPTGEHLRESDFLTDPGQIFRAAEVELARAGGEPIDVKTASGGYLVGGDTRRLTYPHALAKVANAYNVSVADAAEVLKLADACDGAHLWVLHTKHADGPPPPPDAGGGGDPNAGGGAPMDSAAMAQAAAAAQPSPIDLAVAEQQQLLTAQVAALQQQLTMLTTLQQRTQQIAQGGGQMAAPTGAAAMTGGPAAGPNGAPSMAPSGSPPPGGDPGAGGPPPGPPPGGDPSAGGPPPGPPAPGGMLPPPPVMMGRPTPESVASQINPDFLGQAAAMQQDDVFDAAAVASLAQQSSLKELTQGYVPALERALDNLGRVLLLCYIHEAEIKAQLGGDEYTDTEQRVRDVFKGLGEVLLKVDQSLGQLGAMPARGG